MVDRSSSSPNWPLPEGEDTRLARELFSRGLVEVGQLQACLEEVRVQRGSGLHVPLAGLLLERRLVDAQALLHVSQGGHSQPTQPEANSSQAPALPQQLGHYRLGRRLGSGGMGAVYEATHVVTGQRYAIKIMDLDLLVTGDLESRERFRREARLGSRLEHPNVVSVVDADLEGRIPWIVQELLPGDTLSARLRSQGPLPWREALELMIPLADALGHAHTKGILHRDLKPANILFDREGRPCLADFGLARETGGQALRLTMSGEAIGTPNYMAPEQASGAKVQGPSLDVYGLTAVLFQVLTGQPPFAAATLIQTLEKIVQEPAPRVSERVSVPDPLDALIAQALAKSPQDRPQSGAELATAWRDCLELEDAIQVPRRGGPTPTLIGGLLVVGSGLLLGLLWLGLQPGSSDLDFPDSSPTPSASAQPSPSAGPPETPFGEALATTDLGAPAEWTLAWQLRKGGARPTEPVLWLDEGRTADPLGALERPGGAQALFLGDAEPKGEGRWRVRYAPRKGLLLGVGRHPGYLVRALPPRGGEANLPPFRWLPAGEGSEPGQALVGCPNDGGLLSVYAGRGRWEEIRIEARLGVEPIDRGAVALRGGPDLAIGYVGRSRQLSCRQASVQLTWTEVTSLSLDPRAKLGRVRFGERVLDELFPAPDLAAKSTHTPLIVLGEGWFVVDSIVVEGRPNLPDRAALAEPLLESPATTHFAAGLRYRLGPGLGGPCLDIGTKQGRLRLSASEEGLRLHRGERLLGKVVVPALPREGVLSLIRRGDVVVGRLVSGSDSWSLQRVVPLRIQGRLRYGSTGPRLDVLAASIALGPNDPERARHDQGEPSRTQLGKWRATALELEELFDPFLLDPALRTPSGTPDRDAAFLALAARLAAIAGELPLETRRDALARALLAAAYAGDSEVAARLGARLAAEGPAAGLDTLAWLGEGVLAEQMKSGLRISTEAPRIARAGANGVRPLVPVADQPQVDWTLLRGQRLAVQALTRRRRLTPAEFAGLRQLTQALEGVRARGYRGPLGREVGLDLAWCYEALGEDALYRARIEEVLGTRSGARYPWAWVGYARYLGAKGEFAPAAESMVAALARAPGNAQIQAASTRLVRSGGQRWPPAQLAILAWTLSQVASQDAGEWAKIARQAAEGVLSQTQATQRDRALAQIVLLRLNASSGVLAAEGPGLERFLGWLERGVLPTSEALEVAIRSDRLVGHLARLDPRFSGLLGK